MSGFDPFQSIFGAFFSAPRLEAMSNAGRYLRQLDRGDTLFERDEMQIDPELQCALRRIQITSARSQP